MRGIKVCFAAMPNDPKIAFDHWKTGKSNSNYLGTDFSMDIFEICDLLKLDLKILSCFSGSDFTLGNISIEYLGMPRKAESNFWGMFRKGIFLVKSLSKIMKYKSDIVIIRGWGIFSIFFLFLKFWNIDLILSFHNSLWPIMKKNGLLKTSCWSGFGIILRILKIPVLAEGSAIVAQIKRIAGNSYKPIFMFFPTYQQDDFRGLGRAAFEARPFRVLFMGRIEEQKGVFLICKIAEKIVKRRCGEIIFDVCGDGSGMRCLKKQIEESKCNKLVFAHGHCSRIKLKEILSQAHVVIVPTLKTFPEGSPRAAIEAVLGGRPVIISNACPIIAQIQEAAIVVQNDDAEKYCDAIQSVMNNYDFYDKKRNACEKISEQFTKDQFSWSFQMKKVLSKICANSID